MWFITKIHLESPFSQSFSWQGHKSRMPKVCGCGADAKCFAKFKFEFVHD
jgi:hypothetical protein